MAGSGRRYAPEFKARMVELVRAGRSPDRLAKEIATDHHGMVFFGGWDDHDESKNPASGTGVLTFLYPAGARDELERAGRTMDLHPKRKERA